MNKLAFSTLIPRRLRKVKFLAPRYSFLPKVRGSFLGVTNRIKVKIGSQTAGKGGASWKRA